MNNNGAQINKKFIVRLIVYIATLLLMINLNALVDTFQHPEIPYFDEEHLIVGGVTALVTLLLFAILETYFRHLNKAMRQIKTLEEYLSICANCKKIRIPGSDPKKTESWQQVEAYISGHTSTTFSHGICPECKTKLYSGFINHSDSNSEAT